MPIRVLVVDDHPLVLNGLRKIFARTSDVKVVGEASDAVGAVRQAERLHPDVVLMDVVIPGDGVAATRKVLAVSPRSRVLAITGYGHGVADEEMRAAGARGLISKVCSPKEVVAAVRAIYDGQECFATEDDRPRRTNHDGILTRREVQVMALLCDGASTHEAGRALGLSHKTVETHRRNIMGKLGIFTLAGLVKHALRAGLLGRPR